MFFRVSSFFLVLDLQHLSWGRFTAPQLVVPEQHVLTPSFGMFGFDSFPTGWSIPPFLFVSLLVVM
jgi:hypothetical protein